MESLAMEKNSVEWEIVKFSQWTLNTDTERQPSTQNVMHTSDSALIIFQSSLASPGGVTATNVSCALPSVFTYEACFSVYAAPGSTASAIAAPVSPWCPSAWEEFWLVTFSFKKLLMNFSNYKQKDTGLW